MAIAPWTPTRCLAWLCILAFVACSEPAVDPTSVDPSFHRDGGRNRTIVVDPKGRHDATTIQAGIDMAPAGGRVRVMPGTYPESLVIDKGLTLEGTDRGDHRGWKGKEREGVVVAPTGAPTIAIQVATPEPVTIRGLTVHSSGVNGIRGDGVVDVTVERVSVLAVNPPLGVSNLVSVTNNAPTTGRARLVVRESFLDGAVAFANSPTPPFAQTFAIHPTGDVDAVLERNVIRRSGGACIFVQMRNDFAGQVDANIVGNDLDECYPLGRAAAILVAPPGSAPLTQPITATGVVNIVGNTIRNTTGSCLTTTAIHYEFFTGRIEHNSIKGVVQPCATPTTTGARVPSAILVGSFRVASGNTAPLAAPVVSFNDIVGNAQAGLRIAPNITTPVDARCNYWGSASGPSGTGLGGTGDAIVVETGGARPAWAAFATRPVARQRGHGHHDDDDDDDHHGRAKCKLEFAARLSAAEEVPTNTSVATGNSIFFTADGDSVRFRLKVANIQNVLQAHIHVGATGVNGPVVVFLYPAAPPAVLIPGPFDGVLGEGTFTAANLRGPLTGMQVQDLLAQMLAGNTYANVHTSQFTGGEIRGQIHQKTR